MSKSDPHYSHQRNKPYGKPCSICGATRRDENGHDPCIADLPGVLHACCGHGHNPAYVMFENGLVLRGKFKFETKESNLEAQKAWGILPKS